MFCLHIFLKDKKSKNMDQAFYMHLSFFVLS